jgi:hypothetical protein
VRRGRLAIALLAAGALALGGCGSDDEAEPPASSAPPATWPLTGLPVASGTSAELTYPVLVTKVDNTASSTPQLGLGDADLVVEELVEGGLTRLAAFYYSVLPTAVGPVRSMRASDIGIVSPVDASIVASGGASQTIARIEDAGITYYSEGAEGITRDASRPAPYNLFADLTTIAKTATQDAARPPDYLPWSSGDELPTGEPATTLEASFGGSHSTTWTFDGKHYVNDESFADEGDEFPADTVLVLRVKIVDAGYVDPAGNPVPETDLTGTGDALVFHAGRMVPATWTKDGLDAPLTLSASTSTGSSTSPTPSPAPTTAAGTVALTIPAGHVWIELVPAETGDVTVVK